MGRTEFATGLEVMSNNFFFLELKSRVLLNLEQSWDQNWRFS
jgi:hypothetical protein